MLRSEKTVEKQTIVFSRSFQGKAVGKIDLVVIQNNHKNGELKNAHKNIPRTSCDRRHSILSPAEWTKKVDLRPLLKQLLTPRLTLAVTWSRIRSNTSIFSKRFMSSASPFDSSTSSLFVATSIFGCRW
jgi:hypothetical protein